jgi:hypothetical protein
MFGSQVYSGGTNPTTGKSKLYGGDPTPPPKYKSPEAAAVPPGLLEHLSSMAGPVGDVVRGARSIGEGAGLVKDLAGKIYDMTPAGKAKIRQAMGDPRVGPLADLASNLSRVGIDPSDASSLMNIHKNMGRPAMSDVLTGAGKMAIGVPLAALTLGMGSMAMKKLDEFRRVSGVQDPMTRYAVQVGLKRAMSMSPELQHMDPKLLEERAYMIHQVSPFLFEPQNREALAKVLENLRQFQGADPATLRELSDLERQVRDQRSNRGLQDVARIGSGIF